MDNIISAQQVQKCSRKEFIYSISDYATKSAANNSTYLAATNFPTRWLDQLSMYFTNIYAVAWN